MSDSEELLTVAEAAARLGVLERQARRWAAKLPDSDRTLDRTETGRPRTLVRLSALRAVSERTQRRGHSSGHMTGQAPDSGRADDRTHGGTDDRTHGGADGGARDAAGPSPLTVADTYERIIQEQAARIAGLEADKGRLFAALQLAQQNLAREQTLRSMPALAAPPQAEDAEGPQEAPGGAQPGAAGEAGAEVTPGGEAATGAKQGAKPAGFWARLWRGRG